MESSGDLRVRRNDRLPSEEPYHSIALGSRLLPTVRLSLGARVFGDELTAMHAIVLSADRLLLASSAKSKAQHSTIALQVATLCKLWEYLWINGIFSLKDATPEHLSQLARLLATGGWALALRLRARSKRLLDGSPVPDVFYRTDNGKALSVTEAARMALRTSASGPELRALRQLMARKVGITLAPTPRDQTGESMLRQWFRTINELANIDPAWALPTAPYPNYMRLARELGQSSGRSLNLDFSDAADLLVESFAWINERADKFLQLARQIAEFQKTLKGLSKNTRNARFAEFLQTGPLQVVAQWGAFPSRVEGTDLINRCLLSIYSACFTVIAMMNARRRDEVAHRKIGIHSSSMRVVSKSLGVYECVFYIEKNQERVPFYVNTATYRAWKVLNDFQALFRALQPKWHQGDGIFCWLAVGQAGFGSERHWFTFSTHIPYIEDFLRRALSRPLEEVDIHAHAFRRCYALIFFYRYEHGSLVALGFQLQDWDLETVRRYVTDAMVESRGLRLPVELTEEKKIARDVFFADLDAEMKEVGKEKMIASIDRVLSGGAWSGKFGRLVLRLQAKLASRADYSGLRREVRAARIADSLESKGYFPEPFMHGDCMAGVPAGRPAARCANRSTGALEKERASPVLCSGCPFSATNPGHVKGMQMQSAHLKGKILGMAQGSVHRVREERRVAELDMVIAIHTKQLSQGEHTA
ncbi:hypothetical protein [Variovorax sp. J22R115]|uniref:hypothetical protein n=1 Tax=Variovorax sp. J22R115 TaxID=3053509 RepID=UPI002578512D|nr:hypothetical protein [Variovorax sp. J22R115]